MLQPGKRLGQRALVLGGGIAGTLTARVLADHYDEVLIVERDAGIEPDGTRKGAPQGRLVHALLRAGLDAMNGLFPNFEQDLYDGGAVRCRPARDLLFYDALGEWPRPDVGFDIPLPSRPLIERCLRSRIAGTARVQQMGGVQVQELIADGDRIAGVVCRDAAGQTRRELADLVVDATGRAAHTKEWLQRLGYAPPAETRVEVDLRYAGCFVKPKHASPLLGAMVAEPPPRGRYGALVNAQEGGRLIVAIGTRGRDTPQAEDFAGLVALAERLPHPAVFEMVRDAEPLTELAHFGFSASVMRHYDRLERVPERFVCVGDAICSFNPIWGQGMSVAALQVQAFARLLARYADAGGSLDGLPRAFYADAAGVVATPWQLSVGPDSAFDSTRGERGSDGDVQARRSFSRALAQLAQQDPEVRSLINDVYHLLKPASALTSPELIARLMPLMAAAAQPQATPAQ